MKRENWPTILQQQIEQVRNVPFCWGQFDCLLFAADTVNALTGYDFARDYRGEYSSALSGQRLLASCGFNDMTAIAIKHFGEPLDPQFVQRGDLVMFEGGAGQTLGICTGPQMVGPGETGLIALPMTLCLAGWRV